MSTRVQIYQDVDDKYGFRIFRGSNIVLTPHESYSSRENVRRALRTLWKISAPMWPAGLGLESSYRETELSKAVNAELKREALAYARATNARKLAADIERTRDKPDVSINFPSPKGW